MIMVGEAHADAGLSGSLQRQQSSPTERSQHGLLALWSPVSLRYSSGTEWMLLSAEAAQRVVQGPGGFDFLRAGLQLLHQQDGRIAVSRGTFCALKDRGWMEPIPTAEVGKYRHVCTVHP